MVNTITPAIRGDKTVEPPDEILEHLGVGAGDRVKIEVVRPGAVEVRRVISPLTLDELFERFRIDKPVDSETLRDEIGEDMARDAPRDIGG